MIAGETSQAYNDVVTLNLVRSMYSTGPCYQSDRWSRVPGNLPGYWYWGIPGEAGSACDSSGHLPHHPYWSRSTQQGEQEEEEDVVE